MIKIDNDEIDNYSKCCRIDEGIIKTTLDKEHEKDNLFERGFRVTWYDSCIFKHPLLKKKKEKSLKIFENGFEIKNVLVYNVTCKIKWIKKTFFMWYWLFDI